MHKNIPFMRPNYFKVNNIFIIYQISIKLIYPYFVATATRFSDLIKSIPVIVTGSFCSEITLSVTNPRSSSGSTRTLCSFLITTYLPDTNSKGTDFRSVEFNLQLVFKSHKARIDESLPINNLGFAI